ncbi:LLM class flavin-dependent oxidoreductase [Cryptosporangium arvum]|uniref:Flavin-dependent oxidoreductase, F420-dependent methylene-tetrahydromethanopterin reductase n=1 Tax=Cryptosporangium arvum DSM 44712 TaxID=927661 RepID=A0A011AJR0_9ACTN|nr:LLM class flavin-dependent oxidoreductase [Cryptosporangium arvum]EXG82226.1 hypothetical protein CryarDRAFT_3387 [Cryptosporangium arvum DSM 44712]
MTTIQSLAFLTPGNYPDDDPYLGLENTLRQFEYGEQLGFDGAWIRQRHLEHGVGFSAGTPPHAELIGHLAFDGDWRTYDLSHNRVSRLVDNLRGDFIGDESTVIHSPGNIQRPRVQPYSPGHVITGEGTDDFTTRKRYLAYAESRYERTLAPNGPKRILFFRDLVGPTEQILEQLSADPVLAQVSDFQIELPYEFEHEDYLQILHDVRMHLAPELGWRPPSGSEGDS